MRLTPRLSCGARTRSPSHRGPPARRQLQPVVSKLTAFGHRSLGRPLAHNPTTSPDPMPPCVAAHRGADTALGAKRPPASRHPSPTSETQRSFADNQNPRPNWMSNPEQSRLEEPRRVTRFAPNHQPCRGLAAPRQIGNGCALSPNITIETTVTEAERRRPAQPSHLR